jgi:hypothetical protein
MCLAVYNVNIYIYIIYIYGILIIFLSTHLRKFTSSGYCPFLIPVLRKSSKSVQRFGEDWRVNCLLVRLRRIWKVFLKLRFKSLLSIKIDIWTFDWMMRGASVGKTKVPQQRVSYRINTSLSEMWHVVCFVSCRKKKYLEVFKYYWLYIKCLENMYF